jgi:hypothetical protein
MNEAIKDGPESLMKFQKWLTLSDAAHDPQAFVLQPEVVTSISEKLIQCNNPLQMVFCGVEETLKLLKDAVKNKDVVIAESELRWFDLISMQLESLPVSESGLLKLIKASSQQLKFIPEEYDL